MQPTHSVGSCSTRSTLRMCNIIATLPTGTEARFGWLDSPLCVSVEVEISTSLAFVFHVEINVMHWST